jgi:transposase
LAEAMAGRVESHHAVVARNILDHLDFLDHTIDALTAQIVAKTRRFAEQVELLAAVPDLDQATIQVILAETGGDTSRFPTCAAGFLGWALPRQS